MIHKCEGIIFLIKKSYGQPIIFHALMNHLSYVLKRTNPLYEIKDDWSKILVYSVSPNKIPNQGLDSKILGLLKKLRREKFSNESNLKLMIVCYYLRNRDVIYINHMAIFELVSHFFGVSDHIDGLILSIFSVSVNANIYGLKLNKKLTNDSIMHMLKIVKNTKFNLANSCLALTLYTQYDMQYGIGSIDIQHDFLTFCALESICFFAKFSKHESHIKSIIPQNDLFISVLNSYINKEFEINETVNDYSIKIEDKEIFYRIKSAINESKDKTKLKNDIVEFLDTL